MNAAPPPKPAFPTWLIVLLCTVGAFVILIPVLAVLGIYGVRKYIADAKTAEARSSVGELAKDAASTFENGYCSSASRPVPYGTAAIAAKKYQSTMSEWKVDKGKHAGFACLAFSMTTPQYYQYSYAAHDGPAGQFEATARGDLNGDGVLSTFHIRGGVADGRPSIPPTLDEISPEE